MMIISGFKVEKSQYCWCDLDSQSRGSTTISLWFSWRLDMELKLRNYFLLTSYHLPAFCSSADTSCGEGSWSLSRFKLSRLIFNSSRLIRFDKSCCSSSMDFLAGLMRDSATECLRSTISLFSLSNEEYKLRALEAKHHESKCRKFRYYIFHV